MYCSVRFESNIAKPIDPSPMSLSHSRATVGELKKGERVKVGENRSEKEREREGESGGKKPAAFPLSLAID